MGSLENNAVHRWVPLGFPWVPQRFCFIGHGFPKSAYKTREPAAGLWTHIILPEGDHQVAAGFPCEIPIIWRGGVGAGCGGSPRRGVTLSCRCVLGLFSVLVLGTNFEADFRRQRDVTKCLARGPVPKIGTTVAHVCVGQAPRNTGLAAWGTPSL